MTSDTLKLKQTSATTQGTANTTTVTVNGVSGTFKTTTTPNPVAGTPSQNGRAMMYATFNAFNPPSSLVLTTEYKLSQPNTNATSLRINGTVPTRETPTFTGVDLGGSIDANSCLYIGCNPSQQTPFQGKMYSLIICGTTYDSTTVQNIENYINLSMGKVY